MDADRGRPLGAVMTLTIKMIIVVFALTVAVVSAGMLWGVAGLTLISGLILGGGVMFDELERRIIRAIEATVFDSKRD